MKYIGLGTNSMAKSDIEIAREAKMLPISEVGSKLEIPPEQLLNNCVSKIDWRIDFNQLRINWN